MAQHEISITGIAHRDVHAVTATLTGAPQTELTGREDSPVVIMPDILVATFVRTPQIPVWWCESVEIGGGRLGVRGVVSTAVRRDRTYSLADPKPHWVGLVLDILVELLPA